LAVCAIVVISGHAESPECTCQWRTLLLYVDCRVSVSNILWLVKW